MLPEYLKEGNQGPGFDIRVLAVTYDSRSNIPSDIGVAGTDDYLLSENLVKNLILNPKARVAGVGQGYDVPVILVGHDLGGILIKQLILYVENKLHALDEGEEKEKLTKFLMNLTSVFFYSTPHNGSADIKKLMNKIPADNRSPLLTFMTVLGKEMARVNARFTEYRRPRFNERPRFKTFAINAAFCTTLDGIFDKEEVCPEGTARLDIDQYYTVQANHYQVCQPKAMYSNSMTNLGTNIIEVVNEIRSRVAAEQELERLERLRAFGKELAESNNHTGPGRETGALR